MGPCDIKPSPDDRYSDKSPEGLCGRVKPKSKRPISTSAVSLRGLPGRVGSGLAIGLLLKARFISVEEDSITREGILNDGPLPGGNIYMLTSAPSSHNSATF